MANRTSLDLLNKKFNRLLVIEKTETRKSRSVVWKCICDCGEMTFVSAGSLKNGHTQSCGCLSRERLDEGRLTHGKSKSREHNIWCGMKGRCLNTNKDSYPDYGGRGIKIHQTWINSFETFYSDMGPAPEGMSLDRIDVDGDYTPDNCQWADSYTQGFNQRKRKNNTSGRTGVIWNSKNNNWNTKICRNGIPEHLGTFDNYEDAVKSRELAEIEYMGIIKK